MILELYETVATLEFLSFAQNELENCIKSNNDEVLKDSWMKYVASSFCCHDGNFIISHFSQISLFTSFLESFSKRREKCAIAILPSVALPQKKAFLQTFFQSHDNEIIKVKCEVGRTIKILHFWLVHNVCMIRELLISWTLRSKGQRSIIIILGLKPLEISTSKFSNNKKWYSFLRWVKVAVCQGEN